MVNSLVAKKLALAFPKSFINSALEFIAHKEANEWFRLEDKDVEYLRKKYSDKYLPSVLQTKL